MEYDPTIYRLLLWVLPFLLGILGFVGMLAVKALTKMANDVGEIKLSIREVAVKHEELDRRVERIEDVIFKQ